MRGRQEDLAHPTPGLPLHRAAHISLLPARVKVTFSSLLEL